MKIIILVAALVICIVGPAWPTDLDQNSGISISTYGGRLGGYTKLNLNFSQWYSYRNMMIVGSSEIEFPLDAYMAGVRIRLARRFIGKRIWAVEFTYGKNTNNPGGFIKDSDWEKVPLIGYDEKIIYTESDGTLDATSMDVCLRLKVVEHPRFDMDALLGYTYQKFAFEVIGYNGWYLDLDYDQVPIEGYIGEVVVLNRVSYYIPYLGIAPRGRVFSFMNIGGRCGLSPLVWARDFDDHILRKKTGEGRCTGYMVFGGIRAEVMPTGSAIGIDWVFAIDLELRRISTAGDQTQKWYGDDPASDGFDDTGSEIIGIDYKLNSAQTAMTISVTGWF